MHIHCKLSKCIGQIQCSYEHYLVSPPGNDSFWEDLSFTTDVFFQRKISEMRGLTGVKFCTVISTRPNFIMLVQNLGGPTPKKLQRPKTCKILILDDFEVRQRISPKKMKIFKIG